MTLLDTLSSLPLIHPAVFELALQQVTTEISFDQDVKVQVFEMTIRAMGSLLATYQYLEALPDEAAANGGEVSAGLKRYQPRLLEMALDLGRRLAPAFTTTTGLPYARVNLRHGVEKGESVETCEFVSQAVY
jgi:mannosidase alpha-like ER degradation enhancer 1